MCVGGDGGGGGGEGAHVLGHRGKATVLQKRRKREGWGNLTY